MFLSSKGILLLGLSVLSLIRHVLGRWDAPNKVISRTLHFRPLLEAHTSNHIFWSRVKSLIADWTLLPVYSKWTRALNGLIAHHKITVKMTMTPSSPIADSLSYRPSHGSVTDINHRMSSRTSLETSPAAL